LEGQLKSPGFPVKYCNNLDCSYTISGANGKSVHLSIVSFETESRHDILEIRETFVVASKEYSALISVYHLWIYEFFFYRIISVKMIIIQLLLSGKDVGWPLFVSSPGNGYNLRFITDNSEEFGGFHARFARVNASRPGESCPRLFYEAIAEEQTLPTPSRKFRYNTGCVYMINTTNDNAILLQIKALSPFVKLTVYETENFDRHSQAEPLATISGLITALPYNLTSRTVSITVIMTLTRSHLEYHRNNASDHFNVVFKRTESLKFLFAACKCFAKNYLIKKNPIIITSPGYPLEYCDNLNCMTTIEFDKGSYDQTIRLDVNAFSLEHGFDFLHIYDRLLQPKYLIRKFLANFKILECRCPGSAQPLQFSTKSGQFSFDIPPDCSYLDCFLHFTKPILASINFEPGIKIAGSARIVNNEPMGFWYHLASSDNNSQIASFNFTYEWRKICQCGQSKLIANSEQSKILSSPDYPEYYCNMMKCNYSIIAPAGYIVAINITELSLETNEDFVAFFDGPSANNTRLRILILQRVYYEQMELYCRATGTNVYEPLIKSTQPEMFVYFESDVSIVNKGFVLYYYAEPLSGTLMQGDRPSSGISMSNILLAFTCLIFIFVIVVTYQKRILCFARKYGWTGASTVGFRNLTYNIDS
uniref:CUB domain-containing protein n=1 Tax=Dracunculus medinensis TaxID=318479 RepID=A0A158Q4Q5_DRAME